MSKRGSQSQSQLATGAEAGHSPVQQLDKPHILGWLTQGRAACLPVSHPRPAGDHRHLPKVLQVVPAAALQVQQSTPLELDRNHELSSTNSIGDLCLCCVLLKV
jgi:hypothetical protein